MGPTLSAWRSQCEPAISLNSSFQLCSFSSSMESFSSSWPISSLQRQVRWPQCLSRISTHVSWPIASAVLLCNLSNMAIAFSFSCVQITCSSHTSHSYTSHTSHSYTHITQLHTSHSYTHITQLHTHHTATHITQLHTHHTATHTSHITHYTATHTSHSYTYITQLHTSHSYTHHTATHIT